MQQSVLLKSVSCSAHLEPDPLHWEGFELLPADHAPAPTDHAPVLPTDGAHDEAAGANNDLWYLDEVRLSNGEAFDKGLDKKFDRGLCDEGFNEKWFDIWESWGCEDGRRGRSSGEGLTPPHI